MVKVIRSVKELSRFLRRARERGQTVSLVPTMGALHEGHLSLVAAAREKADILVVSIFVNPIQFSLNEDLDKYPRDLNADKKKLSPFKPLVIFYPSDKELYPEGFETLVQVKSLSKRLCGQYRPGHFQGVTTVVAKLFNIIKPDYAFFGEKDYQQQLIIKKMVRDLNYGTEVITLPTVREYDGLAMSSRNRHLKEKERKSAAILYKALTRAKKDIESGETDLHRVLLTIRRIIGLEPTVRVQYVQAVDPLTLEPVKKAKGKVLIALAAHLGRTRLIDNLIVEVK